MEISKIMDGLYHGTYPQGPDYDVLQDLGIGLIINMQSRQQPAASPSVHIPNLWLRTNDNPIARISIYDLARGALAARIVLGGGGRVFVHCRQGRHRSSAMVGAILVTLGDTAEEAVGRIKKQRPRSNPRQWYIRERIIRFERRWRTPRAERSRHLVKMGLEAAAQKDLVRAVRTIRLAIGADPRNADAWQQQAALLAQVGREADASAFAAAEAWLRAAQATAPV